MISEPELLDDAGEPLRPGTPHPDPHGPGRDGIPYGSGGGRFEGGGPYGTGGGAPYGSPLREGGAPAGGTRWERYRRPWVWTLVGALGASVLWAGGLAAYRTGGPDLDGYRTAPSLCAEAPLSALVTALGKRGATTDAQAYTHPALDRSYCSVHLGEHPTAYEVSLRYELHRKTDPGPEFEALHREPYASGEPAPEPVPGLGEKAYFSVSGGTYADLLVLDGPVVLALSVSTIAEYIDDTGPPPGESTHAPLDGVKEFLVEDARELLERLRSAPPTDLPATPSS
ncbi:hypothetical protein [Streptomyces thermolilacinus]|uniref:hypothetical protein n=1 Tax=Streptomyces thermolilacinus TaxID=285540 RepID=UPI0033D67262